MPLGSNSKKTITTSEYMMSASPEKILVDMPGNRPPRKGVIKEIICMRARFEMSEVEGVKPFRCCAF
jgi:hypothetical protein